MDLVHFPIDPVTSKLLTLQTAIAMRAVPLMLDGEHIVVAVSNVARANKLGHRPASSKRSVMLMYLVCLGIFRLHNYPLYSSSVHLHRLSGSGAPVNLSLD